MKMKSTHNKKFDQENFCPSAKAQLVTDTFENSSHGHNHEIFVGLSTGQWLQLYALVERLLDAPRDENDANRIALLVRSLERAVSKSVEKKSSTEKTGKNFLDASTRALRTKKWSLTSEDELSKFR